MTQDRIDAMDREARARLLREVCGYNQSESLDSTVCLDDSGELFVILESWAEASTINRRLNERLVPEAFAEWRQVYESLARDEPFEDMRLGNNAMPPYNRVASYLVPDGLIDLDMICESGFSDEYDTCSECMILIRTSPDSYFWQADYDEYDCGIVCKNCLDADDYIETRTNRNKLVNESLVNPADHGFTEQPDKYESGHHPHMDDNPQEQIRLYNEQNLDVLFTGSPSQFYIEYTVWTRSMDYESD